MVRPYFFELFYLITTTIGTLTLTILWFILISVDVWMLYTNNKMNNISKLAKKNCKLTYFCFSSTHSYSTFYSNIASHWYKILPVFTFRIDQTSTISPRSSFRFSPVIPPVVPLVFTLAFLHQFLLGFVQVFLQLHLWFSQEFLLGFLQECLLGSHWKFLLVTYQEFLLGFLKKFSLGFLKQL